jgi:hypothetical protein
MFRIRDIAAAWVDGRPERQILVDYSPRSTPDAAG